MMDDDLRDVDGLLETIIHDASAALKSLSNVTSEVLGLRTELQITEDKLTDAENYISELESFTEEHSDLWTAFRTANRMGS
jgi:predicted  nucleic acid-binding Zn-ribbon protein